MSSRWGDDPTLNPAQRDVLARLGAAREDLPSFDPTLRDELRDELESRVAPVAERIAPDSPMFLNKFALGAVHGCEAVFLHERDQPFSWNVAKARGTVSHRAIELSVMRRDAAPSLVLVDDAIASLANEERGVGAWLRDADETTRAEVRSESNNRVAAFVDCWPRLKEAWNPRLEFQTQIKLADGRIFLTGKPDLTLGQHRGTQAGQVVVDFKTGRTSPNHRADLRFYALLGLLRTGLPPRLVATYYLDQGVMDTEEVTVESLRAAVDRVVDAAGRIATLLAAERDAERRAGIACRWCALQPDCEVGTAFLREARDDGTLDDV